MSEQDNGETQQPSVGNQINEGIGRVWGEIKQISKQVERETRKTGRTARLKLDLRSLHREEQEVRARLGKAVHRALHEHGDAHTLAEVEGMAGGIAALDALGEQIAAKETEIDTLYAPDAADTPEEQQPLTESEEVA